MKTYSSRPGENEAPQNVPCLYCSSRNHKHLWDVGKSSFVQCRDCSFVYQNPQPRLVDLQVRYDVEYFQYEIQNQNSFLELMLKSLADMGFREEGQGGRFLDIGCATGALLERMKQRGWSVQGVEICRQSAEYAMEKRGVDVFVGPLEEWQGEESSLDVIHSSHVIEHLQNPREMIQKSYKLLKEGGSLFCTTPNISGFQARLFGSRWRSAIEDHLSLFSRRHLARLLQQEGFTLKASKTWGGLAAGAAPLWVKKIADPLAKSLGIGDVMIFHAVK